MAIAFSASFALMYEIVGIGESPEASSCCHPPVGGSSVCVVLL